MQTESPIASKPQNIWSFYSWETDDTIPCKSARRFLMVLCSPGTWEVERWLHKEKDFMDAYLVASGPKTLDGGLLIAHYRLTWGEIHKGHVQHTPNRLLLPRSGC